LQFLSDIVQVMPAI